MTDALLRVEGLTKHFPVRRGVFSRTVGHVRAVDGVSFDIAPGETLGLVGESGSGKTTVGRCILRLAEPTSGRVVFHGHDVTQAGPAELRKLRRDLQVVFQDPYSSLNPRLRVIDIVGEALSVHGIAKGAEVERRVATLLERVGMSPSWLDRYPHEFSGGQRQRIGVARALALEPKLIVCDEAVSALDVSIQAQVVNLLIELRREMGLAYLFVAHDLSIVRHIAHRIAVMYLGRLVEVGPSKRLFEAPAHPYTRALLSAIPSPKPGPRPGRLMLVGEIPSPANPPSGCHFHTRCPAVRPDCRKDDPRAVQVEPGHTVRCIHAVDLPPGGEWFAELSRRIDRATAENVHDREKPAEVSTTAGVPDEVYVWKRTDAPRGEGKSPAKPEAESASLGWVVAAFGVALVAAGHAWLGTFVAASAHFCVVRRRAKHKGRSDAALAVALAVALVVGHRVVEQKRRARARADMHLLSRELEDRARATGALPGSLAELTWRLFPIFPDGMARDPWGRPYRYRAPGKEGRRFDLRSTGPDLVPSEDDVDTAP